MAVVATTSLKRTGTSKYCGMLVSKAQPPNWATNVLLLRFIEENNCNTVFIMSDKARDQFSSCELWRVYEFTVSGSTVKKSSGAHKYGVYCSFEVTMKYAVSDLKLAGRTWPFQYAYKFKDWLQLNQLTDNEYIDLVGRVSSPPVLDANSAVPKVLVRLENNGMVQDVEILGADSGQPLRVGDIVSFSGLKLREWNGRRSLQTVYLTLVEQNPLNQEVETSEEGPRRKAIRLAPSTRLTVSQAQQEAAKLLTSARQSETCAPVLFSVTGSVVELTEKFFDDDAPIVQKGDTEVMCWKTSIVDQTGTITVKLWDKSCYDLFGVTSNRLRELWEQGVEEPDEQKQILDSLNSRLKSNIECLCQATVWRFGKDTHSCSVDVNVNEIDFVE